MAITCDEAGLLLGDIMTNPSMSITRQSFCSQERAKLPHGQLPCLSYEQSVLNGDGYGLGWYTDIKNPCVLTSIKPAWNDPNLESLAQNVYSPVVMAHVRAAGPGSPVGEGQCHPFQAGRFLFMHNGLLGDFKKTQRELLRLADAASFEVAMHHSAIDSVCAFAIFLTRLNEMNPDKVWTDVYDPAVILRAMEEMVSTIVQVNRQCGVAAPSLLNFAVTDGYVLLATRIVDQQPCSNDSHDNGSAEGLADSLSETYSEPEDKDNISAASLYLATGSEWKRDSEGSFHIEQTDRCNRTVLITSEPLSAVRDEWMAVPSQNIVMCTIGKAHVDITFVPFPKRPVHVGSVLDFLQTSLSVHCSEDEGVTIAAQIGMTYTAHTAAVTCVTATANGSHLISGAQDGTVIVWDNTRSSHSEPRRHPGPVLAVLVEKDSTLLFSSSHNELRVWDIAACTSQDPRACPPVCLYVVKFLTGRGTLLSLCGDSETLYLGFQAPQIYCLHLKKYEAELQRVRMKSKSIRFFTIDEARIGEKDTGRFRPEQMVEQVGSGPDEQHNGFVYAMCKVGTRMVSGGGDGRLLVWNGTSYAGSMTGHTGGVTSIVKHKDGVISGSFDSTIREWNIEECRCLKTLRYANNAPVFGLSHIGDHIISSVLEDHKPTLSFWEMHDTQPIHHKLSHISDSPYVIHSIPCASGANIVVGGEVCGGLRLASLTLPFPEKRVMIEDGVMHKTDSNKEKTVMMLTDLVAIPSVSSDPAGHESCLRAAQWISSRYEAIGCTVMNYSTNGVRPVVVGRLGTDPTLPTICLYSHYDVVPVGSDWGLPGFPLEPFTLTGHDGHLYGRGSSDNKAAVVAHLRAVENLQSAGKLKVNVLFLCEGDEENLTNGYLKQALEKSRNAGLLDGVSCVVVTNSNWIDDENPCICYGSRGVVDISVKVTGGTKELHAGSHGGYVSEPLHDLLGVLSQVVDPSGNALIPSFYDGIVQSTPYDEHAILETAKVLDLTELQRSLGLPGFKGQNCRLSSLDTAVSLLRGNWVLPGVCITDVQTGDTATTRMRRSVAHSAVGTISFRTVPGQDVDTVVAVAKKHLEHEFSRRRTPNTLQVSTSFATPWWMCDVESPIFKCSCDAVTSVWGKKPLVVREGGTMSVLSTIQSTLQVPVVQIPLGQSTDSTHLPNERIRVQNLMKGVELMETLLTTYEEYLPPGGGGGVTAAEG